MRCSNIVHEGLTVTHDSCPNTRKIENSFQETENSAELFLFSIAAYEVSFLEHNSFL